VLEDRTLPSTFTVLNLADSGAGSLRAAITSANTNPGADVINFAGGLSGTITLTGGQLSITDPLTIIGPGAHRLAVSGNDASRVFRVAGSAGAVTLAHLTITHGRAQGVELPASEASGTAAPGGGIFNAAAHLTLRNLVFSRNQSIGGLGGALWNDLGATATVTDCLFADNQVIGVIDLVIPGSTLGEGGAIDNFGTLTVTRSTFLGNQAHSGRGGEFSNALGGALNNAGVLTLSHSIFLDNQALVDADATGLGGYAAGGALNSFAFFPTTSNTVTHTLFSRNSALGGSGAFPSPMPLAFAALGGGLSVSGAPLVLTASIVSHNRAVGGSGAPGSPGGIGAGGGIDLSFGASATIVNSVIAANVAVGGAGGSGARGGDAGGGGLIVEAGSEATIRNTIITDNQARGGAGGAAAAGGNAWGGGLLVTGDFFLQAEAPSSVTVSGSTVADNQATGGRGGLGGNGGNASGGGIAVTSESSLAVRTSTVVVNLALGGAAGAGGSAGEGRGGGLYIDALAEVCLDLVTQARLRHNHASTSHDDVFGTFTTCP
jgi:hypothetical protein